MKDGSGCVVILLVFRLDYSDFKVNKMGDRLEWYFDKLIWTPHSLWLKSDKSGMVLHKINLEEQLVILWIKFQILAKSTLLHILILYL